MEALPIRYMRYAIKRVCALQWSKSYCSGRRRSTCTVMKNGKGMYPFMAGAVAPDGTRCPFYTVLRTYTVVVGRNLICSGSNAVLCRYCRPCFLEYVLRTKQKWCNRAADSKEKPGEAIGKWSVGRQNVQR